MINPFRIRVIIPHLPKEGGQQDAQPQRYNRTPVSVFCPIAQRAIPQPDIDRLKDEVERKPDEWEEYLWPGQHQRQHDPAKDEEDSRCPFIGSKHGAGFEAFDKVKTGEEFRAPEYRRDNSHKAQRCPKGILQGREDFGTGIGPVLGAQVEQFEQPPHRRGDQEQADIFAPSARQQGSACAPERPTRRW